ncbi:MAG: hypothetical protein AAF790_10320, partial [Planctomycetota bacterium]
HPSHQPAGWRAYAAGPKPHRTSPTPTSMTTKRGKPASQRPSGGKKKRAAKRGKKKPSQADLADKFACYQQSVQTPEHEVEFFEQAFRDAFGCRPLTLREDFCGTFAVCCEWVKSRKKRHAVGVDLCGETLEWGRDNNLATLKPVQRERVTLLEQDVRTRADTPVDVLAAQNFSFWFFKRRDEVVEYFRIARDNLNAEGIVVLDMMGGGACYEEGNVDKRKVGKGSAAFRYEWEQARFDPITRDADMYIHFRFKDGSRLDRAFEYHWRFWTLPEVREMLAEAGFRESHVYWEQEDDDGEDTGEYARTASAENADAWVCYVVGVR